MANPPTAATPANRLAQEKSPYLLQHAHNPVDWMPWGEEAFARARREDKPIFLSVGYSTCHWCHVMAHESFESPETARVMNELFVNVKVDREERPDVDRVYMTFVQATTGSGGWPMSVWLQPDLKPIVGGTYFPPDDRYGRRGFVSVCRTVADAWKSNRAQVVAQGARILAALRDHVQPEPAAVSATNTASTSAPDMTQVLADACEAFTRSFDADWGGFGDAPKFPRPVTLQLLARAQDRLVHDKDPTRVATGHQAREMLVATLDHMAAGGMHDHLGGGFHRYSVDRFWHVPHFEKMLYDQAQLAVAYLEAFQITGDQRHADVVRDILGYVGRDLTSPDGGFYCAEDADSLLAAGKPEHAEGAFYVWTKAEIEKILPAPEAAEFCARYGVVPEGNSPPGSDPQGEFTGKNILFVHPPVGVGSSAADPLAGACAKLLAVRNQRPRPHLDDKIVTAWNGLMVSAYARAGQVLGDDLYLQAARRCAAFLHANLWHSDAKTLLRSYRQGPGSVPGFADDYAFLIQGLLDLHTADSDPTHLEWATQLQTRQDELFSDAAGGGYFAASAADASVLLRVKEDHDGAEPSANSVSALNLVRLSVLLGREDFLRKAESALRAFAALDNPRRTAQAMPLMLVAADSVTHPPRQIVVAGRPDAPDTHAMLAAIRALYLPDTSVFIADGGERQSELVRQMPYLEGVSMQDNRATAYLCENNACQLPTTDPAELVRRLTAR